MANFVLAKFPVDGHIWRVEWLGPIRLNPFSPMELEIAVVLRRLGNTAGRPPTGTVRTVRIGVGAICCLPLGSLWRDGNFVGQHQSEEIDLFVNTRYAGVVSVRSNKKLPTGFGGHAYGSLEVPDEVRSTDVVSVSARRNRSPVSVLIPRFEIARSWYLRDSELTLRLLLAPIDEAMADLYDKARTHRDGATLHLGVRRSVSSGAVPTIAMLICDEHAFRAAKAMVDDIVSKTVSGQEAVLTARMPFAGSTRIRAKGEWGLHAGRTCFYVYALTAVEIPLLPMIEWFRVGEDGFPQVATDPDASADDDQAGTKGSGYVRITNHVPPAQRSATHWAAAHPPELINAPQIKRKKPEHAPKTAELDARASHSGDADTSPADASSGVAIGGAGDVPAMRFKAVDPDHTKRELLPASFESFMKVVDSLCSDSSLAVRPIRGAHYLDHPSGFWRTLLSEKFAWSFVHSRLRQALCVEIEVAGQHFCLLEVERRFDSEELSACLFGRMTGEILHSHDVDQALLLLANRRGSWTDVGDPFWHKTLPHKYKDEKSFARHVRAHLLKRTATA